MTAVIGILAAGASRRMRGRDKLLEEVDGEPILARQIRMARAHETTVLVAVPGPGHARAAIVSAGGAIAVPVPNADEGMGASISCLAAEADMREADALMLLLADMPDLRTDDLGLLLAAARACPGDIVRAATEDGQPGHPVVFPRQWFPTLRHLTGDVGAREVIAVSDTPVLVRLDGQRAVTDLDTPEAWAAWRRERRL